jgi:hypothetical protein
MSMSNKISSFGWSAIFVCLVGIILMVVASSTATGEVTLAVGIVLLAVWYRQHHPSPINQIADRRKQINPKKSPKHKTAPDRLGRRGESKGT